MTNVIRYPRIYLAIDNCFASKRWPKPIEWLSIAKSLGLNYVEAIADNECDPFYTTAEYLSDWIDDIKDAQAKTGVSVVNLYSGHGTYATTGLAHTDVRIRDHILNNWLKGMVKTASRLNAGLGFFCHAFSDEILRNPTRYYKAVDDLYARLAELAVFASETNIKTIGLEQMYTPHQIPWTIEGAYDLLKKVYAKSGKPLYITIDTGHQTGQKRFLRPDSRQFKEAAEKNSNPKEADLQKIIEMFDKCPYLFADEIDCDLYAWLSQLGCYSPIIHLQQTDGTSSSHKPFTEEQNRKGIVTADRVLESLFQAYNHKPDPLLPPRTTDIYLTLEIFSATADINTDIISRLEKSVEYWRKFIPEDGLSLDKIVEKLQKNS